MPRRTKETQLPPWLWFFLAIPLGLLAVILWQRQRVAKLVREAPVLLRRQVDLIGKPKYVEPDSIPIDIHFPTEPEVAPTAVRSQPVEIASTDDLQVIEGIGPKIAALLAGHGITTFRVLADTKLEQLVDLLNNARLRLADPTTWIEQARLAANGDMDGLSRLQSELKGGRRKAQP